MHPNTQDVDRDESARRSLAVDLMDRFADAFRARYQRAKGE